jgi:hypothetical protein
MDNRLRVVAIEIGEILTEAKNILSPELYGVLLDNNALSQDQAERLICCPVSSIDRCVSMLRQRAKSKATVH